MWLTHRLNMAKKMHSQNSRRVLARAIKERVTLQHIYNIRIYVGRQLDFLQRRCSKIQPKATCSFSQSTFLSFMYIVLYIYLYSIVYKTVLVHFHI